MDQQPKLQRKAGVALWRQISDQIRAGIDSGLADSEGRLPPEYELARRFSVNRHTVRSAIAALASENLVQAIQGRGTFVRRRRRLSYPLGSRTRFSASIEAQQQAAQSALLGDTMEQARTDVANALGIAPDSRVARLEVLGSADALPVSRATLWLPLPRFDGFAAEFVRSGSVTRTFSAFGIQDYTRTSTRIEARHADAAECRIFGLSPGAILLVATGTNVDSDGVAIQYSQTCFPADRVDLVVG